MKCENSLTDKDAWRLVPSLTWEDYVKLWEENKNRCEPRFATSFLDWLGYFEEKTEETK